MKSQDTRLEFIKMRAENKSYQNISDTLGIGKATCAAWERELIDEIAELKRDQLEELYEQYYMTREARITQLGKTLLDIEKAISNINFEDMPPEKLLDYKIKYMEMLKAEYIDTTSPGILEKRREDNAKYISTLTQNNA